MSNIIQQRTVKSDTVVSSIFFENQKSIKTKYYNIYLLIR